VPPAIAGADGGAPTTSAEDDHARFATGEALVTVRTVS